VKRLKDLLSLIAFCLAGLLAWCLTTAAVSAVLNY